jgi:putative DNA primase/helicase
VNTATGRCADFATDECGGDPISLYAAFRRISQGEAAKYLADNLHVNGGNGATHDAESRNSGRNGDDDVVIEPIPANPPSIEAFADFLVRAKLKKTLVRTRIFNYCNTAGQWVFSTIRLDWTTTEEHGKQKVGKDVFPARLFLKRRSGRLVWKSQWPPEPRPLFGLEQLSVHPDRTRLIVEGEAKASAVTQLSDSPYVTLAFSAGSKRAHESDFYSISDGLVILFPDNDPTGLQAMIVVARKLQSAQTKLHGAIIHAIRFVRPDPSWPKKFDVEDLIEEGWDAA